MERWLSGRKRLTANEVTPKGFASSNLSLSQCGPQSGLQSERSEQTALLAGVMRKPQCCASLPEGQNEHHEAGSKKISVRKFICDRISPSPNEFYKITHKIFERYLSG